MSKLWLKSDQNSFFDLNGLMEKIRHDFKLDWQGVHGVPHWARVLKNGMLVADKSGADMQVLHLFAFLHDSCREDEWEDAGHGYRAAELACTLRNRFFKVSDSKFNQLIDALCGHSDGHVSRDTTIQTCWDADRLDLGRVGILPNKKYLSDFAHPIIEQAYRWSIGYPLKDTVNAFN